MVKKTVLAVVLGLAAVSSLAWAEEPLNECGLPVSMGDDRVVELPGGVTLSRATDDEIADLDSLSRQQLVIAAKTLDADDVQGTAAAVRWFREASEASDLYIFHVRVGRGRFTVIQYYPGGNPYGVIFRKGTRTPVATIGDGDVYCID